MSLLALEKPQMLTEGDGGSYASWNTTVFPYLGTAKVSGGFLTLKPRGFAFPHYADCNKIGYVIQGTNGVAGIVAPQCEEEKVMKLQKGEAIFVHKGEASWWYNAGNDDLKIIFLGETQNATTPGEFTYCLFAGVIGVLKGFSTKTITKAYDITELQANELLNSQKQPLITSLDEAKTMPKHSDYQNFTFNFDKSSPDIDVKKGGSVNLLTCRKYPSLEGIELSGKLLKLEPNAMFGPTYYAEDSGVELTYVIKGSGWVQVVGMNGQIALDTQLEAGQLFAVPKLNVVAIGAGEEGIECFSIVTTSSPILGELAGNKSIWKALSHQVLQASLDVSPELSKLFIENISKTSIITPP